MATTNDILGRFAVDDSFFRASDLSVKARAFVPAKDGCTSVFIVTDMSHAECVAHGEKYVAPERGKPIRGYVKVQAGFVFQIPLDIQNDQPPPRHANILGWETDLDAAKTQALIIAENATYQPL